MKKITNLSKIFFALSALILINIDMAFSQISRDEAYYILKTDVLNDDWQEYDIYTLQYQLSANTVFNLLGQTVSSPNCNSWFFFVDLYPFRCWAHSCKYVFVSSETGIATAFEANDYPCLSNMEKINSAPVCEMNLSSSIVHGRSIPQCVRHDDANNMYAIIINTSANMHSYDGLGHWNDCAELYRALVDDFSYPKNHIYTFMSNSLTGDFDGDGQSDVNYHATYSDIVQGLADFVASHPNLNTRSTVLIYVTGYEERNNNNIEAFYDETRTNFWDTASFANLINNFQNQIEASFNIVLQFNSSGTFLPSLSTSNHGPRVVTTSCAPRELDPDVGIWQNPTHYLFTYAWLSGITGYDIVFSTQANHIPIFADSNYDTYITMQEAYWYAFEQSINNPICNSRITHPMYWSSQNPHYGAIQTLCGRIGYDLYTKDDANDDGFEPNVATIINDSPDIWVRNNADGLTIHQLPLSNTRNYIYVRVRNNGSVVAHGDTLQVFVKPATTNYGSHQQQIASVTMPALQPNTDTVFCFPFMFTPHILYSNCDYSILSIIKSSRDTLRSALNSASTPADIAGFVRMNNNAAMKNTAFADATGGGGGGGGDVVIIMAGMSGLNGNGSSGSSLQFSVPENDGSLLDVAEITLSVDDNLSEIWKEDIEKNGALKQLGKNTFRIEQENFTLSDFDLPDDESFWGKISFKVNFLTRKVDSSKKFYKYNVLHRNAENKEVGGITIYVPQERNTLFRADAGNDVVTNRNSTVRLSAREIGEPATCRWYDANGNLLCTGVHFDVTAAETAKYTLEVTAGTDGYKDYDDVTVFVASGKIVSLSPNPVSGNELNVRYGVSETVSGAKLMLFASGSPSESATYSLDLNSTVKKINIGQLRSGSYTLVLVCDDVAVDSKTFVKH